MLLPFIRSPIELTAQWGATSNFEQARAFLTRTGEASPESRRSLVAFWRELEARQVIQNIVDLPPATQELISASTVKHYYPWHFVQKADLPDAPVRLILDSRQSGLNDYLVDGPPNSKRNLQKIIGLAVSYVDPEGRGQKPIFSPGGRS